MRAAILAVLVAGLAVSGASAGRPPNFVFILADDLGYGDLRCYGQKKVTTPNLDRLASEGCRFTSCYAGSTVCAPSRCCLMTGKHTGHCYIRGNTGIPLRPGDVTVAEVLDRAGYNTALVGKWGLGDGGSTGVPTKKGFDYFFGYLNQVHAHNYYPDFLWENEAKLPLRNVQSKGVATIKADYASDLITARARSFLDLQTPDTPFFLYLAYTAPHANNELHRAHGDGMEVPDYGPYHDAKWPTPERGKAAMIHRLDADVATVLEKLRDRGLEENTIVFFSSDNGPHKEGGVDPNFLESSGPLRGTKRDLYEGGIRVPMIVRWPGVLQAGTNSAFPWAFWDVMPTLVEAAGGKAPAGIDGRSVLPTLQGKKQPPPEVLYWEFNEAGFLQAVRVGDWKLIRKPNGKLELYNLDSDLGEKTNVVDLNPSVVARLEAAMNSARTESPEFPRVPKQKAKAKAKTPTGKKGD